MTRDGSQNSRSYVYRRAFTLVELFVTIFILVIILGLMVDLSNRVRRNSADRLTRQELQQLTVLMNDYLEHNENQLPPISSFFDSTSVPLEESLQKSARLNNADMLRYLRSRVKLSPTTQSSTDVFSGLPLSLYDEVNLHDPWGSLIVFMPKQNPIIGMAPGDRFFFMSAGPDRKFLTRDDNLYSYEEGVGGRQ